jgi:hypothetical protein
VRAVWLRRDTERAGGKLGKIKQIGIDSRWREMRACNDNACGESKSQNSHERLLDLTFLLATTDPKTPIY